MNTKALITTLAILGSTSSLAMARPAQVTASTAASAHVSLSFGARGRIYPAPLPAPIFREHRPIYVTPAPIVVRPVAEPYYGRDVDWTRHSWDRDQPVRAALLADDLTYNVGEYRKDIVLEGRGRFDTLMVNGEAGCSFIKEVRIEFLGGAVQSIPVNQDLLAGQSMTFDLDGSHRAINRIFVYRADGNNMNIGSPSRGEFSVTAL